MKFKDVFMYTLGAWIVLAMSGIIALLVFRAVPEPNSQVLYMLLGQLSAAFMLVVGYFYSTSKGSSEKSEMISRILENRKEDQ